MEDNVSRGNVGKRGAIPEASDHPAISCLNRRPKGILSDETEVADPFQGPRLRLKEKFPGFFEEAGLARIEAIRGQHLAQPFEGREGVPGFLDEPGSFRQKRRLVCLELLAFRTAANALETEGPSSLPSFHPRAVRAFCNMLSSSIER